MHLSNAIEDAKSSVNFEEEDTVRDALKGIIKMARNKRLGEILEDDEPKEKPKKGRIDDIIAKVVKK